MNNSNSFDCLDEIAIVGMICRFPGAKNIEQFWQNLRDGVESISSFTTEELVNSGIDEAAVRHPKYVKAGAILEDIDLFDASFFGFHRKEAEITDPQHRFFLECAWEALEEAGYNCETYPGRIGVYAGVGWSTYFLSNLYPNSDLIELVGEKQIVIGNSQGFLPTHVSYKLNLKGPSVNVQTACSTSLVAVHLACQSLLNGESDMVLAGGVSINVPQKVGYRYQEGGIRSPDGHCRAFDAKAQGTVGGNGVGIVVLKRLEDAIADNDCIHAVIKGSAINNDGSLKVGYTAPSVDGQAAVIAEALAMAGVEPETLNYVEAHGSGTELGDPIEIAALTKAYRTRTEKKGFCAIGSVKTNVGHLDNAAGIAGLIKTVLALKHKFIPPSLHFKEPNPQIDFANSPFYVNTLLSEWKTNGTPRRAGVSSFGLGGTNVHVILEEAPAIEASGPSRPWQLLVLSAKTNSALETATRNLCDELKQHPHLNLADVAYTLQVGRKVFSHRRMVICQNIENATAALEDSKRVLTSFQEKSHVPVAFMFPGLGTHYINMGWELYQVEPTFQQVVDNCCEFLKPLLSLDLREVLYPGKNRTDINSQKSQKYSAELDTSNSSFDLRKMLGRASGQSDEATQKLNQTFLAQPALFVIEYALAQLWMEWGIEPSAMVGYSIGEYVAATLAGVLSLEDALVLVAKRAQMIQELPSGAMLAVPLSEKELQPLLNERLSLSAINSSSLCIVAGETDAINELSHQLTQRGLASCRLQTSHAFHSKMMEAIAKPFTKLVETFHLQPPKIPYLSNVTGTWITAAQATDPTYWAKHLCQPVRFAENIAKLLQQPEQILLEVGPGGTLSTLCKQQQVERQVVLSSIRDPHDRHSDILFLLKTLGQLWLAGASIDWSGFYAQEKRHRLPLPTYAFERQKYWVEPPRANSDDLSRQNITQKPLNLQQENISYPNTQTTKNPQRSFVEPLEKIIDSMNVKENHKTTLNTSRYQNILLNVKDILGNLLGMSSSEIDPHTHFLEMGVNSLVLLQFSGAIQEQFEIAVSLHLLLEDFSTIDALANHITQQLPLEELMPEPSLLEPSSTITPQAISEAVFSVNTPGNQVFPQKEEKVVEGTTIEQLMAQHLLVMSKLVDLLPQKGSSETIQSSHLQPSTNTSVLQKSQSPNLPPAPIKKKSDEQQKSQKINSTSFAASQQIEKESLAGLNFRQQQHLDALIARFVQRTQASKRLTQAERAYHANSRAVTGFFPPIKEIIYPIHGQRAEGARLWDVDGNEYVDISMGFGTLLFGHSPSFVIKAIQEQIQQGILQGPQSRLSGQVAELICELTGAERAAFCNDGTEAVMGAIRIARATTGRSKIALFAGSFHGNLDEVLVTGVTTNNGTLRSVPKAPGIPQHMTENVMVLNYGTDESLNIIKNHAHELAAVLVEPIQSSRPDFQPKKFLHQLRQLTKETGTVLIFDEVITGFRMHPGGIQALWDIQADITTYGKAVGAGMPIGVIAGKAAFMDAFDGGFWSFGDESYPRAKTTIFAGTFFKHPLIMAVALAVLKHLKNKGPKLQEELAQRTTKLAQTLNSFFEENQTPIRVIHFGSLFRFTFQTNSIFSNLLFYHLLEKGVYVWEGRTLYLSTAHTDEDIEHVIDAVKESVIEMQAGELLPSPSFALKIESTPIKNSYKSSEFPLIQFSKKEIKTPLVAIQPRGDKRPLFFIHSMGGSVLCYSELGRCLGLDQPFYGLQAPSLNGECEPYTRIEDMASHYITALRAVQPEGPYCLGSWSMGSLIAFEMATQLQKQDHQVALLSLLDCPAPVFSNKPVGIEENVDTIALANFAMDIAGNASNSLVELYDQLRQLEPDKQLNYVLEQLQIANLIPANLAQEQFRPFYKVYKSNFLASRSYVPQVYPNRIILLRASEENSGYLNDSSWGWSQLSSEPIETVVVPGNHYTMLTKPHVQMLAERLTTYLNQV
ncbi:hypothetical protein BZZ01_17380 [Nostocales cyanobacterium HT-58-2]|nr:hypothetical protein BZZ01_17380 [Nostocales cyanobacterium HT-58-2]